uniref:Uncharacterized protein n=1 Tax=Magallana gigas TaxID=29159 RepID=K1R2D0_MAGGI
MDFDRDVDDNVDHIHGEDEEMEEQYVAVQKVFTKHMEDIGDKLKEIPLSLAVDVRYDTPGLIITCMKEIYGRSCAGYTRTRQSKDLDNISANLSGSANPGSRVLLAEMKSRKK